METALSNLSTILSNSPTFMGFSVLMINLGSKYVIADITDFQKEILSMKLTKTLVLFCMVFLTTKDFSTSLIITAVFFSLIYGILNEFNKYNIISYVTQFLNFGANINKTEKNIVN